MAYTFTREISLLGSAYEAGDAVPDSVPDGYIQSMLRLQQITADSPPKPKPKAKRAKQTPDEGGQD